MVNTANAEGRVYRAERSHGKKNRRKFSSIMAMVLGAIVTIEIMIMGAMVLKLDFHSADRIALALGFMISATDIGCSLSVFSSNAFIRYKILSF